MGADFDNNFATQIIERIGSLRSFYLLNAVETNKTPQDLLDALLLAVSRFFNFFYVYLSSEIIATSPLKSVGANQCRNLSFKEMLY